MSGTVPIRLEDQSALDALEARLKTILPATYQDRYEDVEPVSMGSAGLKFQTDGQVAWDDIWGSFCDLAMAGGPPHKGALLEPGSQSEIDAQPGRYGEVVAEICRGIAMVADLPANAAPVPGWVRVECSSHGMAGWLTRAIVMENVSARCEGAAIDLPAGPAYRVEKEIKNVITSIAKTCHYWADHMYLKQQREIANLFAMMSVESPLLQPALDGGHAALMDKMAERVEQLTGLRRSGHRYSAWLGVECPSVRAAIWMMRAMVVSNVLSRREGTALFVPVNPASDPGGQRVAQTLSRVHGFAGMREVLSERGDS